MSREIKFRAWLPEYEVMIDENFDGNNVFQFEDVRWDLGCGIVDIYVNELFDREVGGYHEQGYEFNVQMDAEFLQFAGIKDRNGVDVYSGDVIKGRAELGGKMKRFIGIVNINLPSVTVEGVKQYSWKTCHSILDVRNFEVIGNKYENPELTEES